MFSIGALLSSAALAGEVPRSTLASSKLKWQVRRTSVERAKAAAAARSAAGATADAQPAAPNQEPSVVSDAPGAPRTLRHPAAKAMGQAAVSRGGRRISADAVLQASNENPNTLADPFQDESIPGNPNPEELQPVSQPVTPSQPPPAAGQPTPDPLQPAPDVTLPPPGAIEPTPGALEPSPLPSAQPPREDAPPSMDDELRGDLAPIVEGTAPPRGQMSCGDYEKECQAQIDELRRRDIKSIIFGVVIESDEGTQGVEGKDYPCECKLGTDEVFRDRHFACTTFTWKASSLCHKPLYFEDVQLERYGHSWNPIIQPFASAAHFFVSVPLLPYKMGLNPPHECMYTLGYYRPGSCAPYMIEPIPLSLRGAVYEALGATAFAFWFWPPPTGP